MLTPSLIENKNYYLDPASERVHPKLHQKPALLRGEQSEPTKTSLSLSSKAREVFLFTYPLLVHPKLHQKPAFLRGEQSTPTKTYLSLSSKAREVSLSTYPLLVHLNLPQKTTTFERWAKRALKNALLSLAQSEKSFPLYIPLTSAPWFATENHHF